MDTKSNMSTSSETWVSTSTLGPQRSHHKMVEPDAGPRYVLRRIKSNPEYNGHVVEVVRYHNHSRVLVRRVDRDSTLPCTLTVSRWNLASLPKRRRQSFIQRTFSSSSSSEEASNNEDGKATLERKRFSHILFGILNL